MSDHPFDGYGPVEHLTTHSLGYYLPEHSLYQLQRLQHFLEFLSRITAPRTLADDASGTLTVSPEELAYCFHLLAREITPVLEGVEGPGHVALTYLEAVH